MRVVLTSMLCLFIPTADRYELNQFANVLFFVVYMLNKNGQQDIVKFWHLVLSFSFLFFLHFLVCILVFSFLSYCTDLPREGYFCYR